MADRATFTRASATGSLQGLVTNYNANLDTLEQELENTLSRIANILPNSMSDEIDMNGYKILNMSTGTDGGDGVNLGQFNIELALKSPVGHQHMATDIIGYAGSPMTGSAISIFNQYDSADVKEWIGPEAAYIALPVKDPSTKYYCT